MPIHQLMVENGVNVYFQGHDHLFAREEVDGIVYQEVPMPSDSTYVIGTTDNGGAYTGVKMDASGHLRVTVSPSRATVEYVRAWLPADEKSGHPNGEVAYTYTVEPGTTSVGSGNTTPAGLVLEQNYPNPFNPETSIRYQLPREGFVTIRVLDILGREIALLVNKEMDAGVHAVSWNAAGVPAGIYFYRLQVNGSMVTRKAIVLK
jgi:hypothetical protein